MPNLHVLAGGRVIDQAAVDAFVLGFGFGLFVFTLAWGTLAVVQFAKSLLSGVSP
jgi:hypothetical protein